MRKVLDLQGFSLVDWPVMTPSLTAPELGVAVPAGEVLAVEDRLHVGLLGGGVGAGGWAAAKARGANEARTIGRMELKVRRIMNGSP